MSRVTSEDLDEFPQENKTRLEAFRQEISVSTATIDYNLVARIITQLSGYADLLFEQRIREKDGIRVINRWKDDKIFNELFAECTLEESDDDLVYDRYANDLVVTVEDGQCTIYILSHTEVLIDWTAAKRVIRALHQYCNAKARNYNHYAQLVDMAYESGAISRKLRNIMEMEI